MMTLLTDRWVSGGTLRCVALTTPTGFAASYSVRISVQCNCHLHGEISKLLEHVVPENEIWILRLYSLIVIPQTHPSYRPQLPLLKELSRTVSLDHQTEPPTPSSLPSPPKTPRMLHKIHLFPNRQDTERQVS